MTPKEALKAIKMSIAEHLHKQTGLSVDKHFEYLQYDTEIEIVEQALTKLEALKRYPTSDEVCEALSEYLGYNVIYGTHYTFVGENEICWFENGRVVFNIYDLPPHLITLIGRFYEGLEKGEGK